MNYLRNSTKIASTYAYGNVTPMFLCNRETLYKMGPKKQLTTQTKQSSDIHSEISRNTVGFVERGKAQYKNTCVLFFLLKLPMNLTSADNNAVNPSEVRHALQTCPNLFVSIRLLYSAFIHVKRYAFLKRC